ncbi:hypothetical protein [Streptomyces sasae]|uniref:hypothetical protein n=1 Tax=Streptomyces sasae TaxID=1266772 RepID=UPI00292D7EE5|nr:hypothetical protein [Streptomyces sasae]
MRVPLRARLFAALALLIMCAGLAGGYAGLRLGGWLGAGAGMLAGMTVVCLGARITISLCRLQTQDFLRQIVGDGRAEASADAVLRGIMLYEAAAFPLTADGVSAAEQQSRRTVAYQCAAFDGLPLSVRLTAAETLEVIDQGQERDQVRAAVSALAEVVRECRAGHLKLHDEQAS